MSLAAIATNEPTTQYGSILLGNGRDLHVHSEFCGEQVEREGQSGPCRSASAGTVGCRRFYRRAAPFIEIFTIIKRLAERSSRRIAVPPR